MRTADKFAAIMGITPRHADHLGKGTRKASPKLAALASEKIGLDPLLLFFPGKRTRPLWEDVEECLSRLPPGHPLPTPAQPQDGAA